MKLLGDLYARYMDLVYGVCLKYFKDSEMAKDAVMQVFEQLVTKLRQHEVDNFKGWLYQLTKNHCLMQLRASKHVKIINIDVAGVQNEDSVHLNGILEKEENLEKLQYCISTLTADQEQVIRLFYLEQKCYNDIVKLTGFEWNQVRSFIQNGRRNLKACMEKTVNTKNEVK